MRILLTLTLILLLMLQLGAQKVHTVNSVDDVDDGNCDVTHCSLREAIRAANEDGVASVLWFEINGAGLKVIALDSPLPTITEDKLRIEGNTLAQNNPTTGRLIIDGKNQIETGFEIQATDVQVYGLQMQNFVENAILVKSSDLDTISRVIIGKRRQGNIFIKNGTAVKAENINYLEFRANYVGTNYNFEPGLGNRNGVIVDNNWASYEDAELFIGGEIPSGNQNVFASNSGVAVFASYQGAGRIEGNLFGTGITGTEQLGNNIAVKASNHRGRIDIGGSLTTKNVFAYNQRGVVVDKNNFVRVSENSFYCNSLGFTVVENAHPIPVIDVGMQTLLMGTAQPNDFVEVYITDAQTCNSSDCQGMIYLGTVKADLNGDWQLAGNFKYGEQVVALSRNNGRQSMFSECFIVCPATVQSLASNTGPYCFQDSIKLENSTNADDFKWVTNFTEVDLYFEWSGPNDYFSNEPNPIDAKDEGDYILKAYLMGCPTNPDTTIVTINQLKAEIEPVSVQCQADSIQLTSSVISDLPNYTYHWTGPDGFQSFEANPNNAKASGIYELKITADNCQSEVANIEIQNHFPETFDLGATRSICKGETVDLSLNGFDNYQWSGDYTLTCDTCSAIEFVPNQSGIIQLSAGPTKTCLASASLIIEVLEPVLVTAELILCSGSSLNLLESTISSPGTYEKTYTGSNGCDSIQRFLVMESDVNRVVEAYAICEGETLDQFGESYSQAGTYEASFVGANGCDSVHVLELSVLTPSIVEEQFEICEGESMLVFGMPISESETVTKNYVAANGCDSIHTIHLAIKSSFQEIEKITLCQGETTTLYSELVVDKNGYYEKNYTASNGCDSIVGIEVEFLAPLESYAVITMCDYEAEEKFGDASAFPTNYSETFTAQSGCDSIHFVAYEILFSQSIEENVTICASENYVFAGESYNATGRYEKTFTAANGCDSLHIINLEILPNSSGAEIVQICEGESVNIFGQLVQSAGEFSQSFTNSNGCDSIHSIKVILNQPNKTEESFKICSGSTIDIFGESIGAAGMYSKTFTNANGCDSLHTIMVAVQEMPQTEGLVTICQGGSMDIFGASIAEEGTFSKLFTTSRGCDSLHTINVVIQEMPQTEELVTICQGGSMDIFGASISKKGTFSKLFTTSRGCDSLHTINVVIQEMPQTEELVTICQGGSMDIFGASISKKGTFSKMFTTSRGCDSLHTINVAIQEMPETYEFLTICAGETYDFFGQGITEEGTFSKVLTTTNSCDSMHSITIEIKEVSETFEVRTICAGESVDVFGENVSDNQILSKIFSGSNGCDSTHSVEIDVLERIETNSVQEVCTKTCVNIYGAQACSEEKLIESFIGSNGCDSVHTMILNTLDAIEVEEELALCAGEKVTIFGKVVTSSGFYSKVFSRQNGCDSTHNFNIRFSENMEIAAVTEATCPNQSNGQFQINIEGGTSPYQISLGNENLAYQTIFENLESGIYNITVTDVLNCEVERSITIRTHSLPTIEATVEPISCFGLEDGSIHLFSEEHLSFSLNGSNFSSEASFYDLPSGAHDMTIKNEEGCEINQSFNISEPEKLVIVLPEVIKINLGQSVELEPTTNYGTATSFLWDKSVSLNCIECKNTTARPLKNTKYKVNAYNENNCESSAEILVLVASNKGIYVPNVFSPDDDGRNDQLTILAVDGPVQEVETFKVFDRWGTLLHEANNFQPNDENFGWDGKYKGQAMGNGVYIYFALVKFIDGTKTKVQGDITIAR